jgi:hypothetical protein
MTLLIPTPAPIGADRYPAALRQAIQSLAIEEWEAFGRSIIDYRPVDQPLTKLALLENNPAVFDRLVRYWSALGPYWAPFVDEQTQWRDAGRTDLWAREPWSAAFISWIMKAAGISRGDFQFSASHWRYIDFAMASEQELGEGALYQPLDADAVVPEVGDLICGDRSEAGKPHLIHIADRAAEAGRKRKLHCDLVVGRTADAVLAIGGNLADSVALCHYPAHADGRLVTDPAQRRDHRTLFGLLRCRLRGTAKPLEV